MSKRQSFSPVDYLDFVARTFSDLRTTARERNRDDGAGFEEAYQRLKKVNRDGAAVVSRDPKNADKNRYKNVHAYDATRVLVTKKKKGDDFINANWIPGYNGARHYIASQGPVPASIPDFWTMIWQEQVEVIVMTTREVESGKMKCHRYWPDPTSKPPRKEIKMPLCKVRFMSTEQKNGFTIRKFVLYDKKKKRAVTQVAYESWPDHGVPLTAEEFLTFRDEVNDIVRKGVNPNAPLLVHCSAGVGRTGTFIGIDRYLRHIQGGQSVSIDAIVTEMRQARNHMVQTESQYLFIYKAALDAVRITLSNASVGNVVSDVIQVAMEESQQYDLEQASEREEIKALLQSNDKSVWEASVGATVDEIEVAVEAWVPDGEYDIMRHLTKLQSRIESLKAKGIVVKLASVEEQKQIVANVKHYQAEKQAKKEQEEAKKQEEAKEAKQKATVAEEKMVKKKELRRQSSSAAKFMKTLQ